MTPTDDQLWRTLQPGDVLRIVHLPCEFSLQEYTMHAETRVAYQHLIRTRQELSVSYLDEQGYPWIKFTIESQEHGTEYHSLMLNHDGLELVSRAG
ncbi:MAG: hypothetical protein WD851_06550 [Pirellulales bacterium]